jgi:hypothetical protein
VTRARVDDIRETVRLALADRERGNGWPHPFTPEKFDEYVAHLRAQHEGDLTNAPTIEEFMTRRPE